MVYTLIFSLMYKILLFHPFKVDQTHMFLPSYQLIGEREVSMMTDKRHGCQDTACINGNLLICDVASDLPLYLG